MLSVALHKMLLQVNYYEHMMEGCIEMEACTNACLQCVEFHHTLRQFYHIMMSMEQCAQSNSVTHCLLLSIMDVYNCVNSLGEVHVGRW